MSRSANISCLPEQEKLEFRLFSHLTPELRLKIWQYSLPQGRIVPIRFEFRRQHDGRCISRRAPSGCLSLAQIPANLHVCHESRTEAFKHYQPTFGICGGTGQVFFNPAEDILYFGPRHDHIATESQFRSFVYMVHPDDLAAVRRLAITESMFWPHTEYISSIAARLTVEIIDIIRTRFPYLEELFFVPRDENHAGKGPLTLAEPKVLNLRLLAQLHEAMQAVVQEDPGWRIPNWSVKLVVTENMELAEGSGGEHDQTEDIETEPRLSTMDQGVLRCFSRF